MVKKLKVNGVLDKTISIDSDGVPVEINVTKSQYMMCTSVSTAFESNDLSGTNKLIESLNSVSPSYRHQYIKESKRLMISANVMFDNKVSESTVARIIDLCIAELKTTLLVLGEEIDV